MNKLAVSLISFVFALGVVACGGDGEDAATEISGSEFAQQVCTTSSEWQGTLQTSLQDFQEAATGQSDPAVIKEGVSGAFANFRDATGDLIGKIDALGTPSEEGAQEFKDRYTDTLGTIESSLDTLIAQLDEVGTDSAQKFKTELQGIAAGFQQSLGSLGDPFQGMPEDLLQRFRDEPACDQLVQSSGE